MFKASFLDSLDGSFQTHISYLLEFWPLWTQTVHFWPFNQMLVLSFALIKIQIDMVGIHVSNNTPSLVGLSPLPANWGQQLVGKGWLSQNFHCFFYILSPKKSIFTQHSQHFLALLLTVPKVILWHYHGFYTLSSPWGTAPSLDFPSMTLTSGFSGLLCWVTFMSLLISLLL